jgi:hydrogenase expression/formation protein HypC
MRVTTVNDLIAVCEARSVQREVSLFMLQHEPIAPGDHVMVHLDRAVEKISAEQADAAWALYDLMLAGETR